MEAEETVNMLRAGKEIMFSTNNASVGAIFTNLMAAGLLSLGVTLMFVSIVAGLIIIALALILLWLSYPYAGGKIIGKKVMLKRYLTNTLYIITLDDIEHIDQERKLQGHKFFYANYIHTKVTFSISGKSHTMVIVTPDGWLVGRADPAYEVLHMAIELNKEGLYNMRMYYKNYLVNNTSEVKPHYTPSILRYFIMLLIMFTGLLNIRPLAAQDAHDELLEAINLGDVEKVKLLIPDYFGNDYHDNDFTYRQDLITTTIMLPDSMVDQTVEIAQLLIDAGADINRAGPLITALEEDREMFVLMLINAGADVNQTKNDETVLNLAILKDMTSLIEDLIAAGADVNQAGSKPPLISAVEANSLAVVTLLLEAGADVNVVYHGNDYSYTAADVAENNQIINVLVKYGAPYPSPPDTFGLSEIRNLLMMSLPVVFAFLAYLFAYRQSKKIKFSLGMAGLGFLIVLGAAIAGGVFMWMRIPFQYTFATLMQIGTLLIVKIIFNSYPKIIRSESYLTMLEEDSDAH